MVGLKDASEARTVSSTTKALPGGKIPTRGSTSTGGIEQAGPFAPSVVQSRPSQHRPVDVRPDSYAAYEVTVPPGGRTKENRPLTFRAPLSNERDPEPLAIPIAPSFESEGVEFDAAEVGGCSPPSENRGCYGLLAERPPRRRDVVHNKRRRRAPAV